MRNVLAALMLASLCGCTTSSRTPLVEGVVPASLPRVLRSVEAEVSVPSETLITLKDLVAKGLDGQREGQDSVLVDVSVVYWQPGSFASRHFLGGLAPDSAHTKIGAKVTLVDSRTGKPLRSERLDVDLSAGWAGGLSSGAVKQLAEDVVRFVYEDRFR